MAWSRHVISNCLRADLPNSTPVVTHLPRIAAQRSDRVSFLAGCALVLTLQQKTAEQKLYSFFFFPKCAVKKSELNKSLGVWHKMCEKPRHWPAETNDKQARRVDAMERNNSATPIRARCARIYVLPRGPFRTSRPDTHFLLIRWISDSCRRSTHTNWRFFLFFHIFRPCSLSPKKARLCSALACPT